MKEVCNLCCKGDLERRRRRHATCVDDEIMLKQKEDFRAKFAFTVCINISVVEAASLVEY